MVKNALKSEKTLLVTVLLIFELSYLFRFVTDMSCTGMGEKKEFFQLLMLLDLTYLFEALSFMILLVLHFRNFRPQLRNKITPETAESDSGTLEFDQRSDATDLSKVEVVSNLIIDSSSSPSSKLRASIQDSVGHDDEDAQSSAKYYAHQNEDKKIDLLLCKTITGLDAHRSFLSAKGTCEERDKYRQSQTKIVVMYGLL